MKRVFASSLLLGLVAIVSPFGSGGCAAHSDEVAKGPLAPPCDTGGIVFEETGTRVPRAELRSERPLTEIVGGAVIGGTPYFPRGAIFGAIPVDRISGAAHVTEIWRSV